MSTVLMHDDSLGTADTWQSERLPESPRPIGSESLHSYCTRLRGLYELSEIQLLKRLALPINAKSCIENGTDPELAERLAILTGRPRSRFDAMAYDGRYSVLAARERSAYCPQCWLERRRADAAYLNRRWDYSHVLFCVKHSQTILHEKPLDVQWHQWFTLRAQWAEQARKTLPGVWLDLCDSLKLDAIQEWECRRKDIWNYQTNVTGRGTYQCGVLAPCFRAWMDLAVYLQVQWDPRWRLPELGAAATDAVYDVELCYTQALRGTLSQRLRALLIASILLEALQGRNSTLSRLIFDDCKSRRNTHLECWWIRRRLLRWDRSLALAFLDAVDMRPDDAWELPAFDACRRCMNTRLFDRVDLSLGRRIVCRYEPEQLSR